MDNLFYAPGITEGLNILPPEEARHCVLVLRKKAGDALQVTDGKGNRYCVIITQIHRTGVSFRVDEVHPSPSRHYSIHVAVSPTKQRERLEWFTEKAVELGIDEITPMQCHRTERGRINTERLHHIAISAMKQSQQLTLPVIHALTSFQQVIENTAANQRFIGYVDQSNPLPLFTSAKAGGKYLVLIGPEGDFTPEEVALAHRAGFLKISLGLHRLRTETAALAATQILNLVNHTVGH
jgi:16S rRNA (uracil1498-N3)-methyltransferase